MTLYKSASGAEFEVDSVEQRSGNSVKSRVPAVSIVGPNGAAASGGYTSTATFTPAAAAYLAGDIMQGARELTNIGPAGGGEVLIVNTRLRIDHTAVISGETSYTLHLYSVTPPSALADNAVWDLPSDDRASYMGSIALGTPVDLGSTLYVEQTGLAKQVTVPVGGSLFGYLVTNGGFTATAAARTVLIKTLSA
jgi:hypothetical protein